MIIEAAGTAVEFNGHQFTVDITSLPIDATGLDLSKPLEDKNYLDTGQILSELVTMEDHQTASTIWFSCLYAPPLDELSASYVASELLKSEDKEVGFKTIRTPAGVMSVFLYCALPTVRKYVFTSEFSYPSSLGDLRVRSIKAYAKVCVKE